MNTTLSPVTVQRFVALQGDLIALVEKDFCAISPKLEQLIRVMEISQIELMVHSDQGYSQTRGVGQPESDRCAIACAFLAKTVLNLITTRALIERLQMDSKLRRLCGFDLRKSLPSEATFSRAFAQFADKQLAQRVHERMVKEHLGDQLIGHISRDATAIAARESIGQEVKQARAQAKADKALKAKAPKIKRGRPSKGEIRPTPVAPAIPALEAQRTQTLDQMLSQLSTQCDTGTKINAQGYKVSWRGYKLHLDTACCGVPISAVLTGANVHDSKVALPLTLISGQRVSACYELMDAAYSSGVISAFITQQGRVPLIDHNPRRGDKRAFEPHEAQRYKIRTGAERCNARLKDEFGARHVQVRGASKVMCHLMFGVVTLCADQLSRLLL